MRVAAWAACTVLLSSCQTAPQRPPASSGSAVDAFKSIAVVDCLLPGELRRSGRISYVGPRMPVRTTAELCEIRGGEYVQADRATLAGSLAVWKEKAEGGDADAQYYVGQLHEKGVDAAPDYAQAAQWYRKAAAQNHVAATLALVDLMANGKGMPADPVGAVNLYRKTMGVTDELVSASEADRRVLEQIEKLNAQKKESDAAIARLQADIAALRSSNHAKSQALHAKERELQSLQSTRRETDAEVEQLSGPLMRTVTQQPGGADMSAASLLKVGNTSFGRYYALVIGVQDYADKPLKTPIADAQAVAGVLRSRYGFEVSLLRNPTADQINRALTRYREQLGPDDNFVLYFAGHGVRNGDAAAWVLSDGGEYPTRYVAVFTGEMKARTVFVIADTCFGGALTGARSVYLAPPGASAAANSGIYAYNDKLEGNVYYLHNKGRYVLSSGGDAPATDDGNAGHSIFANALLDALNGNPAVLTEHGLASMVSQSVQASARRMGIQQKPDLQVIRDGGYSEDGLFFFVPVSRVGGAADTG